MNEAGGVGLDVEQAGARKFATVGGHHGEASALKSKNTPFITGRRGSSAAAKSARLMPEKRRAASAPRVEISPSNSGVRGYSWAFLSHEVVVPVLIGDGDVEVVGGRR